MGMTMDSRILNVTYGWKKEPACAWLFYPRINNLVIYDRYAKGEKIEVHYKLNDLHILELFEDHWTPTPYPSFVLSHPVPNRGLLFDQLGKVTILTIV